MLLGRVRKLESKKVRKYESEKVFRIIILWLLIAVSAFAELKEMQYKEVPTRVIPYMIYAYKSLLIIESTTPKLKFQNTPGIKPSSRN